MSLRLLARSHQLLPRRNWFFPVRQYAKEPQYDEADLFAENINHGAYKAKKRSSQDQFQWPEKSAEQVSKEAERQWERMAKLSAVGQGILIILVVGGLGSAYLRWPELKSWWLIKMNGGRVNTVQEQNGQDSLEKLARQKAKNLLREIPQVPTFQHGIDYPGVYIWGKCHSKDSLFPIRVPNLDNRKFRDILLAPSDDFNCNFALDEKGDLISWDDLGQTKTLLAGQHLTSMKYSSDYLYALTRKGEILVVPIRTPNLIASKLSSRRSKLLPWKTKQRYDWKLETKQVFDTKKGENRVVQFDTGSHHLVLLSNLGKAYSCATGNDQKQPQLSRGQFGIPTLSQFDEFPPNNELFEIELLNKYKNEGENTIQKRQIDKIACGSYHTLALDHNGELYAFGWNRFGQLALPISYNLEYVSFPRSVTHAFKPHFPGLTNWKCVDIHCDDETSFVNIRRPGVIPDHYYFAFGNGLFGELGNNTFKNSQCEPIKIKLNNKKVINWSCGSHAVFGETDHEREVIVWGNNDHGQLGIGKKTMKCAKPMNIPDVLKPGQDTTDLKSIYDSKFRLTNQQRIVTNGDKSCIYWRV
ncbi:Fmp25p [Saccharomyces eubayanus]|uniref:Fmp25p n=1 Tax=Saccharomyces eubayanus TaxID=1080349 RepID=UPI0006BEFB83|nr:FMP25-like protein [Saccharomyces eubayanus]KOG97788.1 FMP25-like protein [Saccharomyces eubayanus]